jgi:hypothetical protein
MAGDWIKVRVWISKDPKVIAIADYLAYHRDFLRWLCAAGGLTVRECAYEVISRDITVMITVTSLVITWGITRERGKRVDDSLIIPNAGLDTVDALCGVPGFGEAMASVGWISEGESENGMPQLVFPNFLRHNAPYGSRAERHRDAQRAYRERKRSCKGGDITSDHGDDHGDRAVIAEEKRREEKSREKKTSARAVDDVFDKFWSKYPRKVAKTAARKAWEKIAVDDALLATILAALDAQIASEQWRAGFIPHAATWLNGRRWEDELPSTTRPPTTGNRVDPAAFFGVDPT